MEVNKITLFKNGLSLFEGTAAVKDSSFALEFKKEQMADVLKTLQVSSEDGKSIPFFVFDTSKTLEKKLEEIGLNIPADGSLTALARQMIGFQVQVSQKSKAKKGIVVGTNYRVVKGNNPINEATLVLSMPDQSIEEIPFSEIQSLSLLNIECREDLARFLEEVSRSKKKETKQISFLFPQGKSLSKAKVSFMTEMPVWKVSYRLNLGDEKASVSCLAIIENSTEQDWKNAELSLASGRPISFQYDLYSARFASRPFMQIAEENTLMPVEFQENVPGAKDEYAVPPSVPAMEMAESDAYTADKEVSQKPMSMDRAKKMAMPLVYGRLKNVGAGVGISDGRAFNVTSREVEETTIYSIAGKVNLPKGKSVALPLFSESVPARKLSVYNSSTIGGKNPMMVLELRNSSGNAWQSGPLVAFDSGEYMGESLLKPLKKAESVLLSYALDTAVVVEDKIGSQSSNVSEVLCEKGFLYFNYYTELLTSYNITNKSGQKKTVIIEHPRQSDTILVSPKPKEETSDFYRFEIIVDGKKNSELGVKQRTNYSTNISLIENSDLKNQLSYYFTNNWLAGDSASAIKSLIEEQSKIMDMKQKLAALQESRNRLVEDQNRTRQNCDLYYPTAVPTSEDKQREQLRAKYSKKLSEIDDKIDKVNDQTEQLQSQISELERKFKEKIISISFKKVMSRIV
ncbi:MAG: hypothetical protein Q7R70_06970 [Candidatus Diapherotrites archaeon]|nr:hypothetical protein [Candidatus Diapherotrites archaeon]